MIKQRKRNNKYISILSNKLKQLNKDTNNFRIYQKLIKFLTMIGKDISAMISNSKLFSNNKNNVEIMSNDGYAKQVKTNRKINKYDRNNRDYDKVHGISESVYYKEDNIMNRNEYIASIMLEAAKLLKEDNNSLNESAGNKIYDKAAWHIDNGINPKIVIGYFKTIFMWLNKKGFLNDDGKEIVKMGIGSDASIHSGLLTINGNDYMKKYYDKILKESKCNSNKAVKLLNKYFNNKAMQEAVDLLYEKAVLCEDAAEAEGYIQKAEELQKAVDSIPEEKPVVMDDYDSDVNGGEGEELDHEEIKDLCDGDEEVVKLLTDDEDKSVTVDSSSNNECIWW